MKVGCDEAKRLALLAETKLLQSPAEKAFDGITALAAGLMAAPVALISLVGYDFQWFKAKVGVTCEQTSRDVSFCHYAIQQPDLSAPFIVPDATKDERFMNNPLVTGPMRIRMYVGVPLVSDEGLALGTLCVIDTTPRQPDAEQVRQLQTLAGCVMTLIETRRIAEMLRASEERNRLIVESAADAVVTIDADRRIVSWNARAVELFDTASPGGRLLDEFISSSNSSEAVTAVFDDAASPQAHLRLDLTMCDRHGDDFPAELNLIVTPTRSGRLRTAFIRDLSTQRQIEIERREAETRDIVIFALARLAESRDNDTGTHIERVQHYCHALAVELRRIDAFPDLMDDEFLRLLHTTSPLHDIGKVGIPDSVLLKPGKLNPLEAAVMKTHAQLGADTLEAAARRFPNARFLRMARNIAATHHERYDGTGYPRGLRGDAIPLCGRIVALADVYDALTTRRAYKAAMTHATARDIIVSESGRHFDPTIVDAFMAIERQFAVISGGLELPTALAA